MTRWLLSLLAVVTAAQAQAATTFMLGLPGNTTDVELPISAAECNATLTLEWTYQLTAGLPCTAMTLWATEGDCGDAPATGDVKYTDVAQATLIAKHQDTFNVSIAALPGFAANPGTCGSAGIVKTHNICAAVSTSYDCTFGTKSVVRAQSFALTYDSKPPGAPTITSVGPLDQGLKVDFTVDADTVTVEAWVKGPADADFSKAATVAADTGTVTLTGLANQSTYDVKLTALDAADNVSDFSETWSATPIHSVGFWEAYRQAGGTDPGGCAVAPGLPLLAALALLFRRRRT